MNLSPPGETKLPSCNPRNTGHGARALALATGSDIHHEASYWRWPDRNLVGNAIVLYEKVFGTSFIDAMKELTKG